MMKKVLSYFFMLIASLSLVSAQYYGRLSLGDSLNLVDPSTMVLGSIFIVSMIFFHAALSRTGPLKGSNMASVVVSISLSLLLIWGINRSGWDYYYFFNGVLFFIPAGYVEVAWPLLFFLGVILTAVKWKWNAFYAVGIFLSGIGLLLDGGAVITIVGISMIIGRAFCQLFIKKKEKPIPIELTRLIRRR